MKKRDIDRRPISKLEHCRGTTFYNVENGEAKIKGLHVTKRRITIRKIAGESNTTGHKILISYERIASHFGQKKERHDFLIVTKEINLNIKADVL